MSPALHKSLDELRSYLLNTGKDKVPARLWTRAMNVIAAWEDDTPAPTPADAGKETT